MPLSELLSLRDILCQAIDVIQHEITRADLPDLSNYAIERHPLDKPEFLCPPALYEARRLALASIGQLKTLLQVPYEKAVEQSCAVYDTACLDIAVRTGVIDELGKSEHLEVGLHVSALHQKLDLDPLKLIVVLRYLTSHGWLHESTDNVFALNRPALELLKGENGRNWLLTPGKPRVAASLLDFVTHPSWKYSRDPSQTAFQLANNTNLTLFAYLERNPDQLKQWASSVRSYGDISQGPLLADYPWSALSDRVIIDCGAGQGNLAISLAQTYPSCKFILQDLPEVVPLLRENVSRRLPAAIQSGQITVEEHNFFLPQPRDLDNHVFVFRYIFHDWPESDCVKILKNIASVGGPRTKVLIIDNIVVPSTVQCRAVNGQAATTFVSEPPSCATYKAINPPPFIPDNFGSCAKMSLALGVHLMGVFNALERSLIQWKDIISSSGLQISAIYPIRAHVSVIECSVSEIPSSSN